MLRASFMLATIPAAVFAVVGSSQPQAPIKPVAVATEGVRMIRMDDATFRRRWDAVHTLPPAVVIHEVGGGEAHSLTGKPVEVAARPHPPARLVKRASLRQNICARHGLKKIEVIRGKWKGWRCRR
jgi:hypothetical protein